MNAANPIFVAKSLSLYYGSTPAYRGMTLDIYPNRVTALVGPSGCGKTSFLSTLNRLIDHEPDASLEGRLHYRGDDVFAPEFDPVMHRRRVGYIFQAPNVFPFSIWKNLEMPLRENGVRSKQRRRERIEAVLAAVGLIDEVHNRLHAPATTLSGGQQQRLCIARALVLHPDVLLMDEPTSALDPMASDKIESLIERLARDYSIVLVTHDLGQAKRLADDLVFCWRDAGCGRLIEAGPAVDMFRDPQHALTRTYLQGRS